MEVAHSKAIAIFFVLQGFEFQDLGADYYSFSDESFRDASANQIDF